MTTRLTEMASRLAGQAGMIHDDIRDATDTEELSTVGLHIAILERQIRELKDALSIELEDRRQVAEQLQGRIEPEGFSPNEPPARPHGER